ncbi:DUF5992 family protein [Endozoicomonas arenosclerae]|uniref:DUF5992 family protein n=1 Tax=Endozoicomonas arenosclerae TaxID=1633495 RepID=UPI000782CE6B|nr:DUF5992 family protein [Endozoicomonas arenosclerae]
MKKLFITALLLCSPVLSAGTLFQFTGKVTIVESTYLPGKVTFQMDAGHSVCPAGAWLKWQKETENNKMVYSSLMTALVSDKKVRLYIEEGDDTCTGRYIHLVK